MAMPEIDEVKDAALKYDKKALAKMVQMGQMSNTTAMMAAMMRDRIVQSEMKPPAPPTVADEVFQPAQGLAAVPTDPRMFQGMAGGGIVAMAGGGGVKRFQGQGESFVQALNDREQRERDRSAMFDTLRKLKAAGMDVLTLPGRGVAGAFESVVTRPLRALGVDLPYLPEDFYGGDRSSMTPYMDRLQRDTTPVDNRALLNQADAELRSQPVPAPAPAPAPKPQAKPPEKGLGATPEAAASPIKSIRDQAQEMAASMVKVPKVPTAAEFVSQQSEMDKLMGVDRNLEATELKEIAAQREALKDDRKEAANMRLLEAGLSILGGTSPHAFENIGKGASKALAGFSQDLKDIKKNETDLTNLQRQIRRAENEYKRNKSDKNLAELTRLQERAEDKTQDRTKMEIELELKLRKLGLDEEQLKAYKESVAQGGTSPVERIAKNLRKDDPKLTYEQSIQKAYGMQQEPKTRAALEKEFLENPVLVRQYGTYDNYVKSQSGAPMGPRNKPLSSFD